MEISCSPPYSACWFHGRVEGLHFKVRVAEPSYSNGKKKCWGGNERFYPVKFLCFRNRKIRKDYGLRKELKKIKQIKLFIRTFIETEQGWLMMAWVNVIYREALLQGNRILFLGGIIRIDSPETQGNQVIPKVPKMVPMIFINSIILILK